MATLDVYARFEVDIGGVKISGGSRTPREITVGDDYIDRRNTVGTTSTWDAWLPTANTEEAVTSFEFGWIESDLDGVLVELVCNDGAGTQEEFVIELRANIPLMLGIDDSVAAHSEDFAGVETADVIDGIRLRNTSGSTAAKCRVVLFSS